MESLTYASEREDHPRGSIVSSPTCNYFFREHFNTSKMVGYDSQGGQITLTVLVNKKTYRLDYSRTETFHAKQDILHLAFYQYVGQKETFLSQNNYNTGHCTHTHCRFLTYQKSLSLYVNGIQSTHKRAMRQGVSLTAVGT